MSHFSNILKQLNEAKGFKVDENALIELDGYFIEYEYQRRYNYGQYRSGRKIDGVEIILMEFTCFDDYDEKQITFTDPEREILFKALEKNLWTDDESDLTVTQDDELPHIHHGF